MSAEKDGGAAFPVITTELKRYHDDTHNADHYIGNVSSVGGMSLRDWFAGQALAGIMANSDYLVSARDGSKGHRVDVVIASNAYDIADAMLLARSAPPHGKE